MTVYAINVTGYLIMIYSMSLLSYFAMIRPAAIDFYKFAKEEKFFEVIKCSLSITLIMVALTSLTLLAIAIYATMLWAMNYNG